MVNVLFFASLREQLDCANEQIELPSDIQDIAGLKQWLGLRGGAWQETFDGNTMLMSAVNQQMVQPSHPINNGDEVAFFPPVSGG